MLTMIFLEFGTVTHLDYRIATGPPTVSEDAKTGAAGKVREESLDP